MVKYYAGIGSRSTPYEVCRTFIKVGYILGDEGIVLRSGDAQGADTAFRKGCDYAGGNKEIYIPWKGFNGSNDGIVVDKHSPIYAEARRIAECYHPAWDRLSDAGKELMVRNSFQVLGEDLRTLSNFVMCWTEKGKLKGGTAQAIRIAQDFNIPVLNVGSIPMTEMQKEIIKFLDNLHIISEEKLLEYFQQEK